MNLRTQIIKCKTCCKDIIFVKTKNGKLMPVDYDSFNAKEIKISDDGYIYFEKDSGMISHFATCPEAKKFRKK